MKPVAFWTVACCLLVGCQALSWTASSSNGIHLNPVTNCIVTIWQIHHLLFSWLSFLRGPVWRFSLLLLPFIAL